MKRSIIWAGFGLLAIAGMLFLGGMVRSQADAPIISRVQGGATKMFWGQGLGGDTQFMAAHVTATREDLISAISREKYDGVSLLPAVPPQSANVLKVVDQDKNGRVAAVEAVASLEGIGNYDASAGPEVAWAKSGSSVSKPVLLRSAKPWWIYPYIVAPGGRARIFGRNLQNTGPADFKGLVAIKPKGKGDTKIVEPLVAGRNPMYEDEFVVPDDLAAGDYDVYYHNGAGGVGGWGGPVPLTIKAKSSAKSTRYYVADFQGKEPIADDSTLAIQKALQAASPTGGVVVLGPGIYSISKTLRIPEGVSLLGAGAGVTTIRPVEGGMSEGFPTDAKIEGYSRDWSPHIIGKGYAPLIWIRNKSSVSDLGLETDETSGIGILVARSPGVAENVTISRILAKTYASTLGWVPAVAVRVHSDTSLLSITECDFEGRGGIEINSARNHGLYIARNKMRGIPEGHYNQLFVRGSRDSVIEDNFITGGLRAIVFQDARNFGKDEVPAGMSNSGISPVHTMILGNEFENSIPRRHNDGENMFESNDNYWDGKPTEVVPDGFSVKEAPFNADLRGNQVFVFDGDGVGEFHEIASNTKDSIKLTEPWKVRPTPGSSIKVAGFAWQCLWVDNSEFHIAGPLMIWGSCVDNVVDGHIEREGAGFFFWATSIDHSMTVAFNDLIDSRFIGRGNIRMLGSFVFGNTIRYNEVIDFHYRPSYHAVQSWVGQGVQPWADAPPSDKPETTWPRPDVGLQIVPLPFASKLSIPYLSDDAPLNAWNIIEGNNIQGQGDGMDISPLARHIILRDNAIRVSGRPIVAEPASVISVK